MKPLFFLLFFLASIGSFAKDKNFYFITSDSVKLYVRVAGEGKPCLFVHGGPGSTSYYYEAMLGAPIIEQEMQMIYLDQRGCGRSTSPKSKDYSLKRMEKDMEELRSYLGFQQWAVMGHSFGGILITAYAHDHPKVVSALFLIHCTLNMEASMTSHLEFGLKALDIKDQTAYRNTEKPLNERVWMVHDLLTKNDIWYKLMYRNRYEKTYNDTVSNVLGKLNRDYANEVWNEADYWRDFTPLTKTIKCPVFIMTGDKDYAIGPDHYKSFQFPNQTVVHYIGGHAPFQEEPQWYAEKIISFIPKIK